jgi:hypothetical protein
MNADRYLKVVLTIVALELGVIVLKDAAPPAAAQQVGPRVDPVPVIVTGVAIDHGRQTSLPVTVMGAERPIPIEAEQPLQVETTRPIVVQTADRPLMIKSVQAVPATRPGVELP